MALKIYPHVRKVDAKHILLSSPPVREIEHREGEREHSLSSYTQFKRSSMHLILYPSPGTSRMTPPQGGNQVIL